MIILIRHFDYSRLRNEVHVELFETADKVIAVFVFELGLQPQYNLFKQRYNDEVEALDVIRKSEYSTEILAQDSRRGHVYRGFVDGVKSSLNHFETEKQNAAKKVMSIIEHYGNITKKPLDQETAALDDMLRELASGNYPELINILGLANWLTQIAVENERFKVLMLARYEEISKRTTLKMTVARAEVDKTFRDMCSQTEAFAVINGIAAYEPMIRELNAVLDRYKNILAQEKGERKQKKNKV
jgi:signal transduction histidine kinase